jgi:SAM-dependent methyltransferase
MYQNTGELCLWWYNGCMKKEPKTIIDAEKTILDQRGEGSALKESQRVMSTAEYVFLHDLKKKGREVREDNHLDVWFVQDNHNKGGLKLEDVRSLNGFAYEHNKKVKENEEKKIDREYRFHMYDGGDFRYYLEQTYENPEFIREIPEVIVIHGKAGEHEGNWSATPANVQKAVDKCMERLNWYWDETIPQHFGENLCCPIATKFDYNKIELTQNNLIEYGLKNMELLEQERQKDLFEKYIFTRDKKYIEEYFSEDVLKKLYDEMGEVPEGEIDGFLWEFEDTDDVECDFYDQFKGVVDHEQKRKEFDAIWDAEIKEGQIEEDERPEYEPNYEEMSEAIENYWIYREEMAEASRNLDFEKIKDQMRVNYVARIAPVLDEFSAEYIQDYERFEAEKKLLKPTLVFVGENATQRELMRDYGTDLVLEKFSSSDIKELLELVGKIKASSASLVPGKLRRIKSEFYKSVEGKLDARSEITAETEKEVEILQEIFQKNGGVKKVLDIACGNGRIDIPLLEKGYHVTGVDANENFLQDALRKVLEKNLSGAKFKKGDVIEYRGVVELGSQDAVIYTWHSILEAFGVGNFLHTLGNAYCSLRSGGVLVFDQPTRENPHMENGWYGNDPDSEHHYLSYIMTEEEIKFILKMAGFENVEIKKWTTKPSEEYPEGMHKFTVSARKPKMNNKDKNLTKMFRGIIAGDPTYKKAKDEWSVDMAIESYDFDKKKKKSA